MWRVYNTTALKSGYDGCVGYLAGSVAFVDEQVVVGFAFTCDLIAIVWQST